MNDKEKINAIGRILADLQLEVHTVKRHVNQIREWMLFPDKLNTAIQVEKKLRESVSQNDKRQR